MGSPSEDPESLRNTTRYRVGHGGLALLLYTVLTDTAVKTFPSRSSLRHFVTGAIFEWLAVSLPLWHFAPSLRSRWTWLGRAAVSLILLLGIPAFTNSVDIDFRGLVDNSKPFWFQPSINWQVGNHWQLTAWWNRFGGAQNVARRFRPFRSFDGSGLRAAYGF